VAVTTRAENKIVNHGGTAYTEAARSSPLGVLCLCG